MKSSYTTIASNNSEMKPLIYFFAIIGVCVLIAATATKTKYYPSSNKADLYVWDLDTLTNAANDTLLLGEIQSSNWHGLFQIDGKQLSGTQSIIVIAQRSAFPDPDADQWKEQTRDTLNGALEQVVIDLGRLGAFNYRFILDGGGTQSTEWEAVLNVKKD